MGILLLWSAPAAGSAATRRPCPATGNSAGQTLAAAARLDSAIDNTRQQPRAPTTMQGSRQPAHFFFRLVTSSLSSASSSSARSASLAARMLRSGSATMPEGWGRWRAAKKCSSGANLLCVMLTLGAPHPSTASPATPTTHLASTSSCSSRVPSSRPPPPGPSTPACPRKRKKVSCWKRTAAHSRTRQRTAYRSSSNSSTFALHHQRQLSCSSGGRRSSRSTSSSSSTRQAAAAAAQTALTGRLQQGRDDLVRIALIDQELLALGGEVHLLLYAKEREVGRASSCNRNGPLITPRPASQLP